MSFAIMRCKKLKGMGSVASSLQHHFRERETANADPTRTHENGYWVGKTTDETMGLLRDRLPDKYRKDAVLAVEYMMTASPDWWEKANKQQQIEFVKKSGEWLIEKYGKDNVIAFGVHHDEKTPHVSAFVVPRTADGRLSAKEFIGNRDKMTADQTSYAAKVQDLGLERGIEGSKAKHVTIQQYYARVNAATPPAPQVDVPEPNVKDRLNPTEYGQRVAQSVIEQLQSTFKALQAKAQHTDLAKQQAEAAERARKAAEATKEVERGKAQSLAEALKGLQESGQKMIHTIVKGGDGLAQLQKALQEKFKEQEKAVESKRDKGISK
jgi:23S rRNA pseudoU1915 N3-methylase RlmH